MEVKLMEVELVKVELVDMELVLVGNSLDIFGSEIKTEMYFSVNYIEHIFALLSLEKLLAIRTFPSEPCHQTIAIKTL